MLSTDAALVDKCVVRGSISWVTKYGKIHFKMCIIWGQDLLGVNGTYCRGAGFNAQYHSIKCTHTCAHTCA